MFDCLSGKHTFRLIAVALTLAVLFIGILYGYFLVHQILPIHVRYGFVRGVEGGKRNKAISLGQVRVVTSHLQSSARYLFVLSP